MNFMEEEMKTNYLTKYLEQRLVNKDENEKKKKFEVKDFT